MVRAWLTASSPFRSCTAHNRAMTTTTATIKLVSFSALLATSLVVTACAPPATSEERAIQAVEGYIASAESDQPNGTCDDANLTSGISTEATIYAIEPLGENTDGEVFEVDLIPEGYVQVLITGSTACVLSSVPWSG